MLLTGRRHKTPTISSAHGKTRPRLVHNASSRGHASSVYVLRHVTVTEIPEGNCPLSAIESVPNVYLDQGQETEASFQIDKFVQLFRANVPVTFYQSHSDGKVLSSFTLDPDILESAYGALSWLYPGLRNTDVALLNPELRPDSPVCKGTPTAFSLDYYYACTLDALKSHYPSETASSEAGRQIGRNVVRELSIERANDGSDAVEPTFDVDLITAFAPGQDGEYPVSQWQVDPVSQPKVALGGNWPKVKPFSFATGDEFRPAQDHLPWPAGISETDLPPDGPPTT